MHDRPLLHYNYLAIPDPTVNDVVRVFVLETVDP